jgi:hypothetical protein
MSGSQSFWNEEAPDPKGRARSSVSMRRVGIGFLLLCAVLSLPACAVSTGATDKSTSNPATSTIVATLSPHAAPRFMAGDKPFRFLSALLPGWYWDQWSEANDVAFVTEAKQAGFSVIHPMLPIYERPLGHFDEKELRHLDHLMDVAARNDMYVILPFFHGLAIASDPYDAFYDPEGIEGLVRHPKLREGFKRHMAKLITRVNTVNGRKYSEDPTILSWMIAEEIVAAGRNYESGRLPSVTPTEIATWVQETATYIKTLDGRHLVSNNTGGGMGEYESLGQDWRPIFDVPAVDFTEAEDPGARIILERQNPQVADRLFTLNKPVVLMLSFTGCIDQERYGRDYPWQADMFRRAANAWISKGAAGVTIFAWQPGAVSAPEVDRDQSYSIGNTPIAGAMRDISSRLATLNVPPKPLEFVTLRRDDAE